MRLPILALVLLAAAQPIHAAAQHTSSDMAGDTVPASAVILDEDDMTDPPKLVNRVVIERMLTQHYPRALRAMNRTGDVMVTMVVDPTGVPRLVTVTGSSGMPEFDDAALRVSRAMRFSRPVLNGSPVWVRVRAPVNFRLQQ
jgi:TonB family protein